MELATDLASLALYDIVIYADDSGSMIFEEGGDRINDLKLILGRVAEVDYESPLRCYMLLMSCSTIAAHPQCLAQILRAQASVVTTVSQIATQAHLCSAGRHSVR